MSIPLIHQFLGESLVTVAVIGLLVTLFAKEPHSGARRLSLLVLRLFVILLSIQWLLGLINYFFFPAGARPSLAHPLLMTLVVAAAHILAGRSRKSPGSQRGVAAAMFAGSAVLMWVGMGLV